MKPISRRTLLSSGGAALGLPLLDAMIACGRAAEEPNIIVMLTDDLAWTVLGCYDSSFHESPNIDRLSAQGMVFTQAYSSSPYCSASRAGSSMHFGDSKLLEWLENGEVELFNLAEVLSEQSDVSTQNPDRDKQLLLILKPNERKPAPICRR